MGILAILLNTETQRRKDSIIWFLLFCLLPIVTYSDHMALEEKIGQVLMVHFHGEEVNEDARTLVQELHIGAVTYYNWSNGLHSPQQVAQLSAGLQSLAKRPLLIAVDQEGGRVVRLKEGFPVFPSNQAVAELGDPALARHMAYVSGLALRAVGVNMNLAPVVDVNSNPRNPVINNRSFGSTPDVVIAFGRSALEGYHQAGVATSLKHFPGHGDVEVDSHYGLPKVNKSLSQLEEMELAPFKALAPYADSVMTAHIQVPALDAEERCSTVSKPTLDYLRYHIGFDGVVISDSLVMQGVLKACGSVDEAAIQALNAGCDLLILGGRQLLSGGSGMELSVSDIRRIHQALVQAVKSGRIPEERIDEAVGRVLRLKERYASQPAAEMQISPHRLHLALDDIREMGQRIWKNECNGTIEGLTHWNIGEEFGSFGIGHFIWYPEGIHGPFEETFPGLLGYLQTQGVVLPDWIKQAPACPWKTLKEFNAAKPSKKMRDLQQFLVETIDLQAAYIAQRLENALPLMLEKVPQEKHDSLKSVFYSVAHSKNGLYALIDYVNFKGEGILSTESYNGYGWGLLQVLQHMPENSLDPVHEFAQAAKGVLVQRVENSPPERNERRWLAGWMKRVGSY